MHVDTSPRAEKFIRAHGVIAYIWLEKVLRVPTDRRAVSKSEQTSEVHGG